MSGLSRSILKWLQIMDLSGVYANPRVDFASGFLVAEIVSRNIPQVSMHSYSNFVSNNMRRDNWDQLLKVFEKHRIQIDKQLTEEVVNRKSGSAEKLIEILYTHFTKRAPCKSPIGEISNQPIKPEKTEEKQHIAPPPVVKEETKPEAPPALPNRQRFIGASAGIRSGSSTDLTPISFESASVVKSGPGFLEVRNALTEHSGEDESKVLDMAVDALTKEHTPETASKLISCLMDANLLTHFLTNYPSDIVIHFIKLIAPDLPPDFGPVLVDFMVELFVPQLIELPIKELTDFVFSVPSNDPFTHHYMLFAIFNQTEINKRARVIYNFIKKESSLSSALAQFYSDKIVELIHHDPDYLLPSVLSKFIEFQHDMGVALICNFPPTGESARDTALCELYRTAPEECLDLIKDMASKTDRNILGYLVSKITDKLPASKILEILLEINDPVEFLTARHEVLIDNTTIKNKPIGRILDCVSIAEALTEYIAATQPERISKEVTLLKGIMADVNVDDIARWGNVFNSIHEYLYLAFCDEEVCRDVSTVCITFFKALNNDVFQTFPVLFKAFNYVFPSNCPQICKQNAVEFIQQTSEISPTFSQSMLKLLINFPPKTHPDLDRLVVALKKVRK